jgi:hypothetical protein
MPENILLSNQLLLQKLQSNIPLHIIIEREVQETPFGQITFNIQLLKGIAQLPTLNIVKNRRRKYQLTKEE